MTQHEIAIVGGGLAGRIAALAFAQPATSRLSSTDIQDILTGKNIRVMGGGQATRSR